MTILKEANGCTLLTDGESYIMAGGHTGRHMLSVQHTDNERLEGHWKGYLAANPLIKYKVHYVRENQYREYNANGEKVARKRRTHRTVMACNIADATAQAKAYSRRFYPQCYFTLEGVEEVSK
jgi:hypothetical protein|tara:strand:+ start:340 stop:708 length:369 start_codon:yes stop_codon:yes gene_type:complete